MSTRYDRLQERAEEIESERESAGDSGSVRSRLATAATAVRPSVVAGKARSGVSSLIGAKDTDPEPRAFSRSATEIYSTTVDIDRPRVETEDYWTEYRKNPIIRTQIDSIGFEVFEGGYWIEADSEETEDEIREFVKNMGITAGQTHRPFSETGKLSITQYLVRGMFLGEKMVDDRGRHIGINPVNPNTVEIYTKSGTNILVPPDHSPVSSDSIMKRTRNGDVAAYVQFDEQYSRWQDRKERKFTRDQMLHWARKPDIGETRGNSAIEPVYNRSRALREKFQDNDLAISMKAWPMILFQTGSPENPWTLDEMKDFMKHYDRGQLGPGSFQAVPGDIEIHEFAGETADIQSHIQADVDYIVSGLPGAKYSLGSFMGTGESAPSSSMAGSHERQTRKLIRSIRRDLEALFTPYLKEVAESWGYDPSGLELHIGRPDSEVAPEDIQGNIIRYESTVNNDNGDGSGREPEPGDVVDGTTVVPESRTDTAADIQDEQDDDDGSSADNGGEEASLSRPTQSATDASDAIAALADPSVTIDAQADAGPATGSGMVDTSDIEDELGKEIAAVLIESRDDLIEILELRYGDRGVPDGQIIADEFQSIVGRRLYQRDLRDDMLHSTLSVRNRVRESLSEQSHIPTLSSGPNAAFKSYAEGAAQTMLDDAQSLGTEIGDMFSRHAKYESEDPHGSRGSSVGVVGERVSNEFTDDMLRHRAGLLVRMNIQRLINRCKLYAYRRSEEVVGVELHSRCSEDSHWLTWELAGCGGGEPVRALFADEDEQRIGAQFQSALSRDPPAGFNPLPDVPPFHFGDTAELAPVLATDDVRHEK